VGEAHDHRHAGVVDRREVGRQLPHGLVGDLGEPALGLERQQHHLAVGPDLVRGHPQVVVPALVVREPREGHRHGGPVAEPVGVVAQRLVVPVEVHAVEGAGPGDQLGPVEDGAHRQRRGLDLLVGLGGDLGGEGAATQGEGGDEHDGDERGFLHPVSLGRTR